MANAKSSFSPPPRPPRPRLSQAEAIDAAAARLRNELPLSAGDVCALLGWSRRTLLDRCTTSRFPQPAVRAAKGVGGANLWSASAVREHLDRLIASSARVLGHQGAASDAQRSQSPL